MTILRLRFLAAASLAATTLCVSLAPAAPFEPTHVARDASWVLHVDAEQVFQSKLWDIVQENMDQTQHLRMTARLELLRDFTGVDLLNDLHDVTLYGHGFDPSSAVLMLHGKWDPTVLAGLLADHAKGYSVADHGKHTVHHWIDDNDGKPKWGSFVGNDVIVMGGSESAVGDALDVMDDAARAMTADAGIARPQPDAGVLAFVSADGVEALRASGQARSPILNRIKAGWISVAEADQQMTLHANIAAPNPAAARQLMNALNGIKSFAAVAVGDDAKPAQKTGVALLDAATATVEDDHVVIDWPIPLEQVSKLAVEVTAERNGGGTTRPATTQP